MNWLTLLLGIWLFISPWLLGFANVPAGLWSNIVSGILLIVIGIYGVSTQE